MRRAARTDANHADLVRLMRQLGADVVDCHALDCGFDVSVALNYNHAYVEFKDGKKPLSARKLTDAEEETRLRCQGAARYVVVETEADAVALVNSLRGGGPTNDTE